VGAVFSAQKGRYGAIDEGTTAAGAFQPMIVVGISLFQAIKTPRPGTATSRWKKTPT